MPYLDIQGNGDWNTFRVFATMLYPLDEQKQNQYVASHMLKAKLNDPHIKPLGPQSVDVSVDLLRLVLNSPSFDQIKNEAKELFRGGIIAGDILSFVYLMHLTDTPEPSIRKAVYLLGHFYTETVYGDGKPIPASEPQVRKYWNAYLSVSHLWAALRLVQGFGFTGLGNPIDILWGENLRKFIGIAEAIRLFGTSYIPKRVKPPVPLLPLKEMWQPPIDVEIKPIGFKLEELPDWAIEKLHRYSKRQYE